MIRPVTAWIDAAGDDLTDPSSTRIFVPSIMGAGLVLSVGIALADLARRIAPRAGGIRRQRHAVRRAAALVAPIAAAAGLPRPVPATPRQRLRSRAFYVVWFSLVISFSLYVGIGATFNFMRGFGPFSGHLAMQVFSLAVSALSFVVAVIIGLIAVRHPRPPAWLDVVIDRSPLGAPER